jgi:hypothetical protein
MRRFPAVAIALVLFAVALPASALGQTERLTAEQVAAALANRPSFIQPGVKGDPEAQALAAAAQQSDNMYLVILARQVQGARTARTSANLILGALQAQNPRATIGVVVGKQLNGASLAFTKARVQEAAAAAAPAAADDPVGALTSYAAAVSKPGGEIEEAATAATTGGRPWWQWALIPIAILAIALIVLRLRARSHEQRRRRRGGSIWTAREFQADRLEALAMRHAALLGDTSIDVADPEAADHLQTAGAKLLALRRTLGTLTSPRELRAFAAELDAVDWDLYWVEERAAGRPAPDPIAPGAPGLCFFSHTHGLGTTPIDLRRPDGTIATVYVSPANRAALDRGETPEVSMVHVGTRMVPWPLAPSWYGAYGWTPDDLPGLEYEGEQIWGTDGPEREIDPFEEQVEEVVDEVEAIEEEDASLDEATAAAGLAHPAHEHPPEGPAPTAPPTVDEATAPHEATGESTGFEELDAPPPPGMLAEEEVGLFPEQAPPATFAADGEETLDGPPATDDATRAWDPFGDDDPPRTQS